MVNSVVNREREHLLQIAEEYQKKGYEVIFQPQHEDLPAFLEGYRPDIIAQREEDKVVIKIVSRLDNASAHYVHYLAEKIEKQPDWRFEVVMSNSNDLVDSASIEGSLEDTEIKSRIPVARELADKDLESALLYAWSLAEATLRLLAQKEELSLSRLDPPYLLKRLVTDGVISKAEYQLLRNALVSRNAVAHGFKTTQLTPSSSRQLIDTTEQLLSSLQTQTP